MPRQKCPWNFFSNHVEHLGCVSKERRSKFFGKYKYHAQNECVNSIGNAVNDEIASYEELDGINIMTDARHGWRKNSKEHATNHFDWL
jgi:hypothetical protein